MARKTQLAQNDFQNAARGLRGKVAALVTTSNEDLLFISRNQENIADDVALIADGLQKVAAALTDIYDVCARIEARQKGGTK